MAAAGTDTAKPSPGAAAKINAEKSTDSSPSARTEDAAARDRQLILLRLLVLGGGSYRPFGFFR
jgi:hypothetical protein